MSQTINFEELDQATHDYLVAVRDAEGAGTPGVFVPTKDSLPGCGCIMGPIVIGLTLALTLTTWLNVVYEEPKGVALLQTAGMLVGGWLLVAGFRGSKGSDKVAGTWVYADPLFLYEAFREQVTITAIDDVHEASFTHNYNNGSYQNSVVSIRLSGSRAANITVANEALAERMVVYLNYLAWARGGEGGDRANLPPATLGGLAKYVAKNDNEPLDGENNINLSQIDLDVTEVPEQPSRDRRATLSFVPYVVMLVAAGVCYVAFAFVVNPPVRDDAIFNTVAREGFQEPRFLRAYLTDPRNTRHRDQVKRELAKFYIGPIAHAQTRAADKQLGAALAGVLTELSTADQELVSMRVTETKTPAAKADTKAARQTKLRDGIANGLVNAFMREEWGQPIRLPEGLQPREPLPPRGQQLITFVEPPEGAPAVHFDVSYAVEETGGGQYRVDVTLTIRATIEDQNATTGRFQIAVGADLDDAGMTAAANEVVKRMFGPPGGMPAGGFVPPQPPGVGGAFDP